MGEQPYWETDHDPKGDAVKPKYEGQFWIGKNVIIGTGCKIQPYAFIPDGVVIGDNVFIGPNATFCNDKYPPSGGKYWMSTSVGNNAVIGAGAVILPGVSIGEYAVIGAGAVVTKSVPAGETWVGNPARPKGVKSQIVQGIYMRRD